MVILIFTLLFAAAVFLTRSYRFFDEYYSTALFVSSMSLLFQILCRGHLLWGFRDWGFFTDKLSNLVQFVVLFPATTVLFLSHMPHKKFHAALYYLGFVAVYVVMEAALNLRHEIIYRYNWNFFWSVFIDFVLFAAAWIHSRRWKLTWPLATGVIVFLMIWFRVPLEG